jgi:hypothetical protein
MSFPSTPTPRPPTNKAFFTRNMVSTMVLLGIVVLFVGTMTSTSTIWIKAPEYDDYSNYDAYEDAYKEYQEKRSNTVGTGNILIEIGGLLACMGFLGGAIEDNMIDVKVKVAFISAAIAFIITVLIVLSTLSSLSSL